MAEAKEATEDVKDGGDVVPTPLAAAVGVESVDKPVAPMMLVSVDRVQKSLKACSTPN